VNDDAVDNDDDDSAAAAAAAADIVDGGGDDDSAADNVVEGDSDEDEDDPLSELVWFIPINTGSIHHQQMISINNFISFYFTFVEMTQDYI
jgi:hypothetical protein